MDKLPEDAAMENPPQPPLAGLNPADLLAQGVTGDTIGNPYPFQPPSLEEMATLFPQFEILELIGKGGMGAVYKVRQKELDRIVALKILPPAIGETPGFSARFAREAKALAKLNHPGIVTLYEFGSTSSHQPSTPDPQLFYFLMEFVDGVNLAQLMQTGRISPREALAIVPQICDALQFAHDQGIVHRDIKPENILLDRLGRVKVADFGIAKVVAAVCEDPIRSGDIPVPTDQTLAGKILGTPQYMAPEQIDHPAAVDHRADIYALGVVFYQMLTGELPGKELQAPSRKVQIDVRLDEIVLKAMEKNPEQRFQQASVMKTRIETVGPDDPLSDPPAAVAAPFKASPCYYITPEHAASFYGRYIYLYSGKGVLNLDTQRLIFSSPKATYDITLSSIISLGTGVFSWSAKPTGLNYISIGYLDGGITKQVRFTPAWSGLTPTWQTNSLTDEWLHQIRAAAKAVTGVDFPQPVVETKPHFSGCAIAGACLIPFYIAAAWLNFGLLAKLAPGTHLPLWEEILTDGLLLFSTITPFGTVFLGIIAVVHIRNSKGMLHGMWLALLNALLFPLLLLDFGIAYFLHEFGKGFLHWTQNYEPTQNAQLAVVSIILWLIVDLLIIRAVWKAVSAPPTVTVSPVKEKRFHSWIGWTVLVLSVLYLLKVILGISADSEHNGKWQGQRMSMGTTAAEKPLASIRVASVVSIGSIVIFDIVSDAGFPAHEINIEYSGIPLEKLPQPESGTGLTGLLVPNALSRAEGQTALIGSSSAQGPGTFRFGFALPDGEKAEMVVHQAREMFDGKVLPSDVCILFYLKRFTGKDAQGKDNWQWQQATLRVSPVAAARASTASHEPTQTASQPNEKMSWLLDEKPPLADNGDRWVASPIFPLRYEAVGWAEFDGQFNPVMYLAKPYPRSGSKDSPVGRNKSDEPLWLDVYRGFNPLASANRFLGRYEITSSSGNADVIAGFSLNLSGQLLFEVWTEKKDVTLSGIRTRSPDPADKPSGLIRKMKSPPRDPQPSASLTEAEEPVPDIQKLEAKAITPKQVAITILADRSVAVDGVPISLLALTDEMKKAARANPDVSVSIRNVSEVPYAKVVEIIDLCQKSGIWNLSFATIKAGEEKVGNTAPPVSDSPVPTFGPVIERVLLDSEQKSGNNLLDLDNGNLATFPPGVSTIAFTKNNWMTANGYDAYFFDLKQQGASSSGEGPAGETAGIGLIDATVLGVGNSDWDELAAPGVVKCLANQDLKQPWVWRDSVPRQTTTWIFRCREGGIGMFQVLGLTENPRGVKIRYKLVQNEPASRSTLLAPAFTLRWIAQPNDADTVELPFAMSDKSMLRVSKTWLVDSTVIDTVSWSEWHGENKKLSLTLKDAAAVLALQKATSENGGKVLAVVWHDKVIGILPVTQPWGNGLQIPLVMSDQEASALEHGLKSGRENLPEK